MVLHALLGGRGGWVGCPAGWFLLDTGSGGVDSWDRILHLLLSVHHAAAKRGKLLVGETTWAAQKDVDEAWHHRKSRTALKGGERQAVGLGCFPARCGFICCG